MAAAPGEARGEPAADPAALPPGGELELDWRVHAAVIGVGGLGWIASEALFKSQLAPATCRTWCEAGGLDLWVRDRLRWDDTEAAHDWSNLVGFVIAPAGAFGLTALAAGRDGRLRDWPIDAVLILESVVLAADLNQITKFGIGRSRPFVAAGEEELPGPDSYLSFYSGHTSLAFSLAVSSGTVASIRGYRVAPAVWATGLTAAVATGWLRIAADRHYATDVLTGAAIGSAMGLAVPLLMRRDDPAEEPAVRLTAWPVPGGGLVSGALRW